MSEPDVITLGDGPADALSVGGKVANLTEVVRLGFRVPQGFVLTTKAFGDFVSTNNLGPRIRRYVSSANPRSETTLSHVAARIRDAFVSYPISASLRSEITRAMDASPAPSGWAVRSSATAEDLPSLSFAGQQESYLCVHSDAVADHVKLVWASLYTARAIYYRHRLGVGDVGLKMAVLAQHMVDSDVSGVMFTSDPEHGKYVLVEAVTGFGERLVSGGADPASYLISKRSGKVLESNDAELGPLTPTVLTDLVACGNALVSHFGTEQDVEFTVAGDTLFILQARPITA